jgi:hypothetical protein
MMPGLPSGVWTWCMMSLGLHNCLGCGVSLDPSISHEGRRICVAPPWIHTTRVEYTMNMRYHEYVMYHKLWLTTSIRKTLQNLHCFYFKYLISLFPCLSPCLCSCPCSRLCMCMCLCPCSWPCPCPCSRHLLLFTAVTENKLKRWSLHANHRSSSIAPEKIFSSNCTVHTFNRSIGR